MTGTDAMIGLREVMTTRLGIRNDQIEPGTRLVEDLGLDSLDAVELGIAVERRFDIDIAEEELARLATVGDVATLIQSRILAKRA